MSIQYLFDESNAMHPNGGARLSPAECGFIICDVESLCNKYRKELDAHAGEDDIHNKMIQAHLEALEYIKEKIDAGQSNKPDKDAE